MNPTQNDRLIAIQYLQEARELISLATYRMESDDKVIDEVKNPEECALWDLLHQSAEVIEILAKERYRLIQKF
jgi:hypothetical protein